MWSFSLDDRTTAHNARLDFARYIRELGGGDTFDCELIFAELVNNAVIHGRGPVRAWVERNGGGASLHVRDYGDGFDERAVPQHPETLAEGGRGLHIVKNLARDFSIHRDRLGTEAVAELPLVS